MNTELKIKTDTVIRTIVLAVALINQILTACGHSLIPVTDEDISEIITAAVTIGASLWSWWKNNSFTKKAIAADEYMKICGKDSEAVGDDGNEI